MHPYDSKRIMSKLVLTDSVNSGRNDVGITNLEMRLLRIEFCDQGCQDW